MWLGGARRGGARHGAARSGLAGRGVAWLGVAWSGMARHGMDNPGLLMKTWVVFRCRIGSDAIWAWGLAGAGPSFDELYFTTPNGLDPVPLDRIPELQEFLFTCPAIESEVASRRDTFPQETVPAYPATVGTPTGAPPARSDRIGDGA